MEGSIFQVGYDVLRHRIWTPGGPDFAKDFMSYCGPEWTSDYTYRALYEDQRRYTGVQTPVVDQLVVRALYDEAGLPELLPVYVVPAPVDRLTAASPYSVVLVDASGQVVAEAPAAELVPADGPADGRMLIVRIPLPAIPVSALRIVREGQVLTERPLALEPRNWLAPGVAWALVDERAEVRWDSAGEPALVRVSTDGETWMTLAHDIQKDNLLLETGVIPEGAQVEVRLAVDR